MSQEITDKELIRLLLLTIVVASAVVLLVFVLSINTSNNLASAYKNKFKTGDQPIIVDNTKKRIMITTVTILDCSQNETQCKVAGTFVNRTDLGNVSKGEMRVTKVGANVVY